MSQIDELVKAIGKNFRCMGGDDHRVTDNPIAAAMAKRPLMFALGVDVREVVEFLLDRVSVSATESEKPSQPRGIPRP